MKIHTSRFGDIEISPEHVITAENGLYGYPDLTSWTLIDEERAAPFRMLQSLDNPEVAFVLIDPRYSYPEFELSVTSEDLLPLSNEKYLSTSSANLEVYVIVTLKPTTSLNLLGPLVFNPLTKKILQVVNLDQEYTIVEPFLIEGEPM